MAPVKRMIRMRATICVVPNSQIPTDSEPYAYKTEPQVITDRCGQKYASLQTTDTSILSQSSHLAHIPRLVNQVICQIMWMYVLQVGVGDKCSHMLIDKCSHFSIYINVCVMSCGNMCMLKKKFKCQCLQC